MRSAYAFLVLQAVVGLIVLLQFNRFTVLVGIHSHGHIELLTEIKRDESGHVILGVHGIGAGSKAGMHEHDYARSKTFGGRKDHAYEFNEQCIFFRKWPMSGLGGGNE